MSNIQERSISISTRTIITVVATILLLRFMWEIRDLIALVFAALILAALINPFAQWAKKYRIPKGISVLAFYVVFIGGLVTAILLVLPEIVDQAGRLGELVGKSWQVLSGWIESLRQLSTQYGLSENLRAGVSSLQGQATTVVQKLFSTLTDLFGGLAGLVVVLVIAYYMVAQEEEALQWFKNFLPEDYQKFTTNLLREVQDKFGRWLIGQLSLSLIVGVLYYVGLRILGVEGALVLAILGGFTEFIPYLGPILGGIPAVLVALSQSPMLALLTLILFVIVQQLENHVLVPKVMQKAVGLNPVLSIVALLVGGKLFGIAGAILAIPVTTACAVAFMEIYRFQYSHDES
ncbi:MAG TPA: AI-2E family transporter [Candidatus Methylomirabilis sp.]|nr:AI-2E family transporter [Candidatus Methylomirabilis sp.]